MTEYEIQITLNMLDNIRSKMKFDMRREEYKNIDYIKSSLLFLHNQNVTLEKMNDSCMQINKNLQELNHQLFSEANHKLNEPTQNRITKDYTSKNERDKKKHRLDKLCYDNNIVLKYEYNAINQTVDLVFTLDYGKSHACYTFTVDMSCMYDILANIDDFLYTVITLYIRYESDTNILTKKFIESLAYAMCGIQ